MPARDIALRLTDILDGIERIQAFTNGMCFEQFAVRACFGVIGEAARHVPEHYTAEHAEIPWQEMVSMRNFVVHAYWRVSVEVLWDTITNDLPDLQRAVSALAA
jgi:uncharacterized protein with HEPN domain